MIVIVLNKKIIFVDKLEKVYYYITVSLETELNDIRTREDNMNKKKIISNEVKEAADRLFLEADRLFLEDALRDILREQQDRINWDYFSISPQR